MRNLAALLARFTESLLGDEHARDGAQACIEEVVGFALDPKNISIKGDTLELRASPIKQNEIKLREPQIIESINLRCKLFIKRIRYI